MFEEYEKLKAQHALGEKDFALVVYNEGWLAGFKRCLHKCIDVEWLKDWFEYHPYEDKKVLSKILLDWERVTKNDD